MTPVLTPPEMTTQATSDLCVNSAHMTVEWLQSLGERNRERRKKRMKGVQAAAATAGVAFEGMQRLMFEKCWQTFKQL